MNRTEKPEDGIMPDVPPKPNETAAENPVTPPASDEMTELRQRAEQAERQRDEYLGLLKTAQADYENAHQRNRREREQEKKYAAGPLARDLLPALDNLERAVNTAKEANDTSPLAQGVALVYRQILDALSRHGITRMESLGQPFNPHLHQSVMQMPSAEHAAGTVLQVYEQGFLIHDRVLRPATVVIATTPNA